MHFCRNAKKYYTKDGRTANAKPTGSIPASTNSQKKPARKPKGKAKSKPSKASRGILGRKGVRTKLLHTDRLLIGFH